jgi:ATP-dependent DNA ligase
MVFDSPPYQSTFESGVVRSTMFEKEIDMAECMRFVRSKGQEEVRFRPFRDVLLTLEECTNLVDGPVVPILHTPIEDLPAMLDRVLAAGGEGLMLRDPRSYWEPKRSHRLLKVKSFHDAEATIIGYTWGRETDKGSKLLGLMGALVVEWNGALFELSGFTHQERRMMGPHGYMDAQSEGERHPGEPAINGYFNPLFPVGARVTFRYRELTDGGVPKEARYHRRHYGE